MTHTDTTFQTLAIFAATCFERAKRGEDGPEYLRVRDDAPEWVTDMVREAAHEGASLLPDDYRYRFAAEAVDIIAEHEDEDEARDAAREWEADIYTHDLTAWLHSRPSRVGYLSDAVTEWGNGLDGFGLLAMAQQAEFYEVFDMVLDWLVERASTLREEG